ncbi:MAG: DUF4239 domain-containing protein [Candidatus Omnitrophica bacterium]|nr:DUF4239 domain-containing protein [Candidatus Omnitrophota bacterium]
MPFTQALLYYVPPLILGLMIVSVFVTISIIGLLLVRLSVPHHRLKIHNDVAGAIFNTLGVAYTVLLAFVVVIAWQNFDKCSVNVEKEANCVVDLYRDSGAFPETFRDEVRSLIKDYVIAIIKDEWKMLARGEQSPAAHEILNNIWAAYSSFEPKTESEKIFLAESVGKLNEAGEFRRLRIMDSRTGIHSILWVILVTGGVVTIMFTLFFGSENPRAQILMASMLAMVIAMILFTILLLDFPFTGGMSISSAAFRPLVRF